MPRPFDAIVVGSGFGGAVAACRLAEANFRVLVLERGRRWFPGAYPRDLRDRWIYNATCPQHLNGWLEFHIFRNMIVATGAAVGGGSLVYANVSEMPPDQRFAEGWPLGFNWPEELEAHYAEVGRMLNVQRIPDNQHTRRYNLMVEAAKAIGGQREVEKMRLAVRFDPNWSYDLPEDVRHTVGAATYVEDNGFGRRQGTCIHAGMCDVGCPTQAKNTLDLNYLARAEDLGTEIRELHIVRAVEPAETGYRIWYDKIKPRSRELVEGHVEAGIVILAAGSLGSTALLLRARGYQRTLPKLSSRLGRDWSANGNFLTPGIYNVDAPDEGRVKRRISPTYGPTITSRISYLDGKNGPERYTVEEGGIPPLLRGYLDERLPLHRAIKARNWRTKLLLAQLRRHIGEVDELTHVMPWFANGVDGADGRLYLGTRWLKPWQKRLKMKWQVRKSEKVINRIIQRHKELCEATGGRISVPLMWRRPFRDLVTPHPLGGCNMGSSPDDGVVDHTGEVFGYPGLYVLDGSIIPESIGINPSRTIAALAERNIGMLIEKLGGKREPDRRVPRPAAPEPVVAAAAGLELAAAAERLNTLDDLWTASLAETNGERSFAATDRLHSVAEQMRALVAETGRRAKEVADILATADDAAVDDAVAKLTANNPELAEKVRAVAKGSLREGLIDACRFLEREMARERADLAEKVTHPSAGDLSPRFKCALYAAAVAGPICVALATTPLATPLFVSVTATLAGAVSQWESSGCQPW
jgi:cholesterol oxidase